MNNSGANCSLGMRHAFFTTEECACLFAQSFVTEASNAVCCRQVRDYFPYAGILLLFAYVISPRRGIDAFEK